MNVEHAVYTRFCQNLETQHSFKRDASADLAGRRAAAFAA